MALVGIEAIDFSYGTMQVLFGVSLHIEQGEILALLGTNGAGKSTLLRVLSGLAPSDRGRVVFDGTDVTNAGVTEMVRRGLVLLPGGKAVFPDMTVAENLDIGGYTMTREPVQLEHRRRHVLELFPRLGERYDQTAGSMSGGEQQQLALAKALLLEPKVLCIDELSLGLAPAVVETMLDTVRTIRAAGTTVVLVEQSLNVAASICDRAVFMEKGEIRFEGAPSELLERDDIARAVFLGGAEGRSVATNGAAR